MNICITEPMKAWGRTSQQHQLKPARTEHQTSVGICEKRTQGQKAFTELADSSSFAFIIPWLLGENTVLECTIDHHRLEISCLGCSGVGDELRGF